MQGITLDMLYQFTNSDEHALIEQMKPEAEKRVKYRFILEEIVNLEKIEISDKEAKENAKTIAGQYNMKEEDLLKEYGGLDMLKYDMTMQKVIDIIKE